MISEHSLRLHCSVAGAGADVQQRAHFYRMTVIDAVALNLNVLPTKGIVRGVKSS
jgi:hypothetical protein